MRNKNNHNVRGSFKLTQPAFACSKLAIKNTRTRCEICSKFSRVFIVNFEHISNLALVFLLLTLKMKLPTGKWYNFQFFEYHLFQYRFTCHCLGYVLIFQGGIYVLKIFHKRNFSKNANELVKKHPATLYLITYIINRKNQYNRFNNRFSENFDHFYSNIKNIWKLSSLLFKYKQYIQKIKISNINVRSM